MAHGSNSLEPETHRLTKQQSCHSHPTLELCRSRANVSIIQIVENWSLANAAHATILPEYDTKLANGITTKAYQTPQQRWAWGERVAESHTAADAMHNHETMTTLSGITVAQVRVLEFTPYASRVCFLLFVLSFAPIGFTPVLRFFPHLKNQHFRIPIHSGTQGYIQRVLKNS